MTDDAYGGEPIATSEIDFAAQEKRAQALQLAAMLNPNGTADLVIREAQKFVHFLDGVQFD